MSEPQNTNTTWTVTFADGSAVDVTAASYSLGSESLAYELWDADGPTKVLVAPIASVRSIIRKSALAA